VAVRNYTGLFIFQGYFQVDKNVAVECRIVACIDP
jgi:hypothetical protein